MPQFKKEPLKKEPPKKRGYASSQFKLKQRPSLLELVIEDRKLTPPPASLTLTTAPPLVTVRPEKGHVKRSAKKKAAKAGTVAPSYRPASVSFAGTVAPPYQPESFSVKQLRKAVGEVKKELGGVKSWRATKRTSGRASS